MAIAVHHHRSARARRCIGLLLALSTICFARSLRADASAASLDRYVEDLVTEARGMGLASSRQWLRLGHWRTSLSGAFRSDADGDRFFLSPRGATDPNAELAATLRGFFAPASDDDHPVCRFPARLAWLSTQLSIDPRRIAHRRCPKLERFIVSLAPKSATVVFSSYYLSSAASAFGHTLLRINKQGSETAPADRRQLLDTGINYSAEVNTGNAVLYAFKGLAGMFRGTFQRMPYYYKVREYNDFESRDLWEYELSLRGPKLLMLVLHLWELGGTHFDYFYLSENCSFHILSALEAADPSLDLLSRVKWPVIPADTIKALTAAPGLVSRVDFRPSLRAQFRARIAPMTASQRKLVSALADSGSAEAPAGMSTAAQAAALDAAMDLLDLRYPEEILTQPDSSPAKRKLDLLERRANLAVASPDLTIATPDDQAPHLSHGSRRLALGSGITQDSRPFGSFRGRLALHDLGDPSGGFPETSQLEFFPFELRYWFDDGDVAIERASLVTIVNLVPVDRFSQKLSWHFDTGMRRIREEACTGCATGFLDVGGGVTLGAADSRLVLYTMAETSIAYHPDLDGALGPVRLGLGGSVGGRARLGPVVALARAQAMWLPRGAPTAQLTAEADLRWHYARQTSLGVSLSLADHATEATLDLYFFY